MQEKSERKSMRNKNEKKSVIICRCEDITLEEIEKAIDNGFTTLTEIKQVLRCGMGPCQGRTCMPQIAKILSRKIGKPITDIVFPKVRFPLRPIRLCTLYIESHHDDESKECRKNNQKKLP